MTFRDEIVFISEANTIRFERLIKLFGLQRAYAYRCVISEYSMRYSESMLRAAAQSAGAAGDLGWESYFLHHLQEEKGHHQWAVEDLVIVNNLVEHEWQIPIALESFMNGQLALCKSPQYIMHLGYCLAVESFQGSKAYWKDFAVRSGLPLDAFRNAIRHSEIDIHHASDLWRQYTSVQKERKSDVKDNAFRTMIIQANILDEAISGAIIL